MESSIPQNEIIIVIADHVLTPRNVRFEVSVKKRINEKQNRLAVAGVCRINSKSNDLLQLTDLMIGAINYNLKSSLGMLGVGDKNKIELANYFRENVGAPDFLNGHRSFGLNIFVDKDILVRKAKTETPEIEKGQSS